MNTLPPIHFANSVFKYCCLLLVISFLFASCKKYPQTDEHPAFLQAIHNCADTAGIQHLDQTFHFIDSAFNTLINPGIGDVFVKDSLIQSKYFFLKHDYEKAMAYLDTMLALVQGKTGEEKYAERYAIVLYLKGEAFRTLKRYNEAFSYISQGEEATLKLVNNKCNMIDYNGRMANLMFEQEKYLVSAGYYLQQSQHLLSVCDTGTLRQLMIMAASLNNAGLSYLRAGMPDSAAWCEDAALHIIARAEDRYSAMESTTYAKAVVYGDQAEVLALKGKPEQAAALYKKSIAGTSKPDTSYTQLTRTRLAELYLNENNNDSAMQVLEQVKNSLVSFSNEKALIKCYKLLVQYYIQTKQQSKAFAYQKLYDNIKDSVEVRDKKFIAVDLAKEFENLELKYTNEILQKEGKLKSFYLIITVFIFVVVAAITFFVWFHLKRMQKLHRQVAQKNTAMQMALVSLEQSHQENSRIIRIVAHDLKNPVRTINNLVFSLLRKNCPENLKEIFQVIKTACSNSMVLINDVLNHEKDKAAIRTELVDMKRLLEYCVDLLQSKAIEKNQHLSLQAEDVSIMLNRQKMWRVISNIINNAIKFSPEHTAIDVTLQRKPDSVVLSVRDSGIGIPENLKDKIFTMSPEASRTGTFGEVSYGLGLSISQKIIEEHKGKIWFDSADGEGAVFYVELPCFN